MLITYVTMVRETGGEEGKGVILVFPLILSALSFIVNFHYFSFLSSIRSSVPFSGAGWGLENDIT